MDDRDEVRIREAVAAFDNNDTGMLSEHEVSAALRSLRPKNSSEIGPELLAELMAFDFCENYRHDKTGWGTYFGPMMVSPNEDGTATESPSIQRVTPEMLTYWEMRANESKNPILKARYAGLVWDFSQKITGSAPPYEIGKLYIECLIVIAEKGLHRYERDTIEKLERALSLAIAFKDQKLSKKAKDVIVAYEKKVSVDNKPGLWGFGFDLLVNNSKVELDTGTESAIIDDLEQKLSRLTDPTIQKIDPWAAESAAKRLAKYYRKKEKETDVKRVILQVGKAYDQIIDEASAFQASGWLEQLHNVYLQFGLKDEAENILIKLRELGPKVNAELKPISHSIELPKKKIDEYLKEILQGDLDTVLKRIAVHYIPIKKEAKEQIFDLSKEAPTQFLITHKLQDSKGRIVSSIGSLEDDLEGHIVRQISQNLAFSAIFLRMVINGVVEQFSADTDNVIAFIKASPIFAAEKIELIEKGTQYYFNNDYVAAIHVLIPQIEDAVRNLVEFAGGNVLKPSKSGGFNLRTFDEVLRDKKVTAASGEDLSLYLRILFTDQRGWNLRNHVCHGTIGPSGFNQENADRVFHSLLCLGLLRKEAT